MKREARIPETGRVWATASRHAIVDLGADAECPRRAETLIALGLPRKMNFTPWLQGRLVARIPLEVLPTLIEAGAPISAGGTYYQTTHHWTGLGKGEKMAPVSCDLYDREEREDQERRRIQAGSKVFTSWKHWYYGSPQVSKALGGIRRYGINTPIALSVVARTHGIGRDVVRFIDKCPHWQRDDIYQACRQLAIEEAQGVIHLTKGTIGEEYAHRCLKAAKTGRKNTLGLIDQSAVGSMWKADVESLMAYDAVQACFATLYPWMKTGLYGRGEDMVHPMNAACHAACMARGYEAVHRSSIELPQYEGSLHRWCHMVTDLPVYQDAFKRAKARQVERLCELTAHPAATLQ